MITLHLAIVTVSGIRSRIHRTTEYIGVTEHGDIVRRHIFRRST